MTLHAVARRYAAALFDVVRKRNTIDRVEQELNAIRDLVAGHDDLRRVFDTPTVPAPKKRAIVDAVLAAAGGVSDETRRLFEMLADRDRLIILPALASAFSERAMQSRNVVAADVTTAVPLPAGKRDGARGRARPRHRRRGDDDRARRPVDHRRRRRARRQRRVRRQRDAPARADAASGCCSE